MPTTDYRLLAAGCLCLARSAGAAAAAAVYIFSIIFPDGTGRYINSSTTGRDFTTFFFDSTGLYILFSRRDGTVRIFFHCTGECNAKHTALVIKATAVFQVKVIRRIISDSHTISYVHHQQD